MEQTPIGGGEDWLQAFFRNAEGCVEVRENWLGEGDMKKTVFRQTLRSALAQKAWLPTERPTFARAILVGILGAGVGAIVRLPLQEAIGSGLPFVTFFPAIMGAALWGGVTGGLVCVALSCAVSLAVFSPASDPTHLAWSIVAFAAAGGLLAAVGSALASSIRELRSTQRRMETAEADLRTLVAELAHRSRNGLTVIMAMVSQSARNAGTSAELAKLVNARLGAMADAQDEVVRGGGNSAALRSLLERTLIPFDLGQFSFQFSPDVHVPRETAAALRPSRPRVGDERRKTWCVVGSRRTGGTCLDSQLWDGATALARARRAEPW